MSENKPINELGKDKLQANLRPRVQIPPPLLLMYEYDPHLEWLSAPSLGAASLRESPC